VRAVGSARQALEEARERPPALVFIGPRVAGSPARLCAELKLAHRTNTLPVVRVVRPRRSLARLEVEPEAILAPPCGKEAVAAAIRRALAGRDEVSAEGAVSDVHWRLPSDPDALERFNGQFARWLEASGLSPFQMQQTGLAVRELAANAIEWGHAYERERIVSVAARLDEEKVSVLVRDTGPGFNPRDLPHAARPGDPMTHLGVRADKQLREGGYGILMASGLVDHLAYNDAGNEALAIKYLRRRPALVAS
jgi:anti-sigma regulatory factor (Ser/Thr protein kinase)